MHQIKLKNRINTVTDYLNEQPEMYIQHLKI